MDKEAQEKETGNRVLEGIELENGGAGGLSKEVKARLEDIIKCDNLDIATDALSNEMIKLKLNQFKDNTEYLNELIHTIWSVYKRVYDEFNLYNPNALHNQFEVNTENISVETYKKMLEQMHNENVSLR